MRGISIGKIIAPHHHEHRKNSFHCARVGTFTSPCRPRMRQRRLQASTEAGVLCSDTFGRTAFSKTLMYGYLEASLCCSSSLPSSLACIFNCLQCLQPSSHSIQHASAIGTLVHVSTPALIRCIQNGTGMDHRHCPGVDAAIATTAAASSVLQLLANEAVASEIGFS